MNLRLELSSFAWCTSYFPLYQRCMPGPNITSHPHSQPENPQKTLSTKESFQPQVRRREDHIWDRLPSTVYRPSLLQSLNIDPETT